MLSVMYSSNQVAAQGLSQANKMAYTNFIIIFVFLALIPLLRILTASHHDPRHPYAFVMGFYLPASIVFLLMFLSILFYTIKTWNYCINKIKFVDNVVTVSTFPVLWIKAKTYVFKISEVSPEKNTLTLSGQKRTDSIAIWVKRQKLYIVRNFFDEYELISGKLLKPR